MSTSPKVIEFYDLPPRPPEDRTPRIIGRLTAAGAAILDAFPDNKYGYSYSPKPADDFKVYVGGTPEMQALSLITKEISLQALKFFRAPETPYLFIKVFNSDIERPLAPRWHRDGYKSEAENVQYIIGDTNPRANTEYATIAVPTDILPFNPRDEELDSKDKATSNFIRKRRALAQVGSNEILEMFGDTPHRSTSNKTGVKRFFRYNFS